MSSALVRQALELVDQEDSGEAKRGGRRARPRHAGQDHRQLYKSKSKKPAAPARSQEQQVQDNVSKLLKLSARAAHPSVADKIVERAVRRKPLADTTEEKQDDHKSILFPETETFQDFEKELFCSISGVTCGGKTSLAHQLASTLAPVHVFHQDKYFFPDDSTRHVRCASLPHNNYDILSALDMDAMLRDVTRTLAGDDRAHATTTDVTGRYTRPGKKFLIAEGFTVLNYPPIMEMCDLRYYFVLELGECRARRALRLYEPPDIEGYFELCVWPEHLNYKAEIEKDKRVKILDGTRADAFDIVMEDIKALNT